jgi:hypothetical protein
MCDEERGMNIAPLCRPWIMTGCALVAFWGLGAAWLFRAPVAETARASYEKLRPAMTLTEAQQALGEPGSDTPPADLMVQYLFTCSAVYCPKDRGPTQAHYWTGHDGLIVARFDAEDLLVAKLYHRARRGPFADAAE